MHRRTFLQRMSAAAALPWLAGATRDLDELRRGLAAVPDETAFWREVRGRFLLRPGLVYMNAATVGATPRPVVSAYTDYLWEVESDPENEVFGPPSHRMEDVRARGADFLGADLDELALTRNTTEGMDMVAQGMELRKGDQILSTDHEHPGGSICWEWLAQRTGAEVVRIEMPATVSSADEVVSMVKSHLTPRTRVCSFSHVSTITGLVMPMAAIAEVTRPRGILLACDGAQAPGMLNVNVHALGVDTYASSSHKWMLAPKGSGLLYIRKEAQERVQPLFLRSGYRVYTGSGGTRNVAGILAHGVAMGFHDTLGRDKVEARCRELRRYLREALKAVDGVKVITPEREELCGGILTISLVRGDAGKVRATLAADHDVVLKRGSAEYNAIRISTHIFNDESDVDRAVGALATVMRGV
ncbi:MAG: aminotransferase class V-fold PLP-dependent enzyme [Gemmatimonadetes bacterium]|nr:aminotransferase class V-fold PLP-dependent enzyme [Gemmatimonadota bacterium]